MNQIKQLEEAVEAAVREIETLRSLEKQYSERLGELAQRAEVVCKFVLGFENLANKFPDLVRAAEEIMEYVEAVRP